MKRVLPQPLLILACLTAALAPTAPATGSEDAGTRSVFAEGAGCRALSLGDAGSALVDDNTVLFRNPGALGLLTRYEVQAGHSNLIGMGFGEQYFSFTAPSWRWGVAGIGYRRFGVDGIERRDAYNHLVDDDLSDNEQQVSLAYGKAFDGAWSLGGALKLRRHQIAGLQGNGIGLDLGLFVRPARLLGRERSRLRHFGLGLALRNIVEPTVKLDQASVPDPGSVRFGLSCDIPVGAGQGLTAALDVEHVAHMTPRLQAGCEYRIHVLSLRVGYLRDHATAGFGLTWRDVVCDYTWEDNPLEPVHRFGVGLRFGPSTHEKRQAELDEADAALRRQLEAAFAARQAERIKRMLADSETAINERDFDRAVETLTTVRTLAPENEAALGLSALAHLAKAEMLEAKGALASAELEFRRSLSFAPGYRRALEGLTRCQEESDRLAARSEEMRRLFSSGMDAFSQDRLVEASGIFSDILRSKPDDAEAAAMLARTRSVIEARIPSLIDRARERMRQRDFDGAESSIDRVNGYDPVHPELDALRGELAAARRAADERTRVAATPASPAPAVAAAPATRRLNAEDRRELASLYARGQDAAAAGRMDEALRYWELVWSMDPGHQKVSEYLLSEYLMRGMEVFAEGRLEDAVELWRNALRIDPDDERALGYVARANEQLARTREILND